MSSKAEYKRTVEKLKERREKMPEKVMVKPKHLKKLARNPDEAKEILKRGRLPLKKDEPVKLAEGEHRVDMVPLIGDPPGGVKVTNGVELPNWVVLIKEVRDMKVAKRIARMANSWYRKLYGLEETKMVQAFQPGDDVWWTKKGLANTGQVVRLKTRKLVVRAGVSREYVVLPVRKVKKGPVPKEYLQPDPKRWRIGRVKGGERQSAEAVGRGSRSDVGA